MIAINLIRRLILCWVRWTVYPKDPFKDSLIENDKPLVYALQTRSALDFAVTQILCQHYGLPIPTASIADIFTKPHRASFIYIHRLGLFQTKRLRNPSESMEELIRQSRQHQISVQIVPVSIFWGRNPGTDKKTPILDYFLYGADSGGVLKRILQLFLHGRNIFCNIGKPLSSLDPVTVQKSDKEAAKMLRRVLRVHYQRQHDSIVGPQLYVRSRVINEMIHTKNVQNLIQRESSKTGQSAERIETKAKHYADEVVANLSHATAVIASRVVTRVVKKVYDKLETFNHDSIRALAEKNNIVFIPSHRSHVDYLLFNYIVYTGGLIPPHTIAGNNLNFWPVGQIVRRGGGIFIRRSFQGNRLYGAMVGEFISYLLSRGFPFCVYTEGGRSRSGALMSPKIGILSMIFEARKVSKKPIVFVPVFINYDKLVETRSYQQELQGKGKQKESLQQVLQNFKVLRLRLGTAHFSFGEPISLDTYVEQHPQLKDFTQNADLLGVPKDIRDKQNSLIYDFAVKLHQKINAAAILTPVALVSTLLLASRRNAISKEELSKLVTNIHLLFQHSPTENIVPIPTLKEVEKHLSNAKNDSPIHHFHHSSGDVLHFHEEDRGELIYFRNNVIHIFTIPALILSIVGLEKKVHKEALKKHLEWLYPYLKEELFLELDIHTLSSQLDLFIQALYKAGWLHLHKEDTDHIYFPSEEGSDFQHAMIITETIGHLIDKYALMRYCTSQFDSPLKVENFRKSTAAR
ncbi:MAG: 1-acyl-sn-glycerol-3-phosphate acyltransferase, partial [Zetaproteobacteria bacterium]|nr:1-acyl-sn-glycerol-3-phosphate acyltransferase [Zetaproteobacteria bacterium]